MLFYVFHLKMVLKNGTDFARKAPGNAEKIYYRPVLGTIRWRDIEALFEALGGQLEERAGSRIAVQLFGEVRIFHRPHPSPETSKAVVDTLRRWLQSNGVKP